MQKTEVFTKIVDVIKPYVTKTESLAGLSESSNLLRDLGINSARLVDIVLDFEDKFDIAISDAEADQVETVGDALNLVELKLAA